ncbi:MAG: reverse transcriptase domain-containing protein [Isosphaeraceae bacterium]
MGKLLLAASHLENLHRAWRDVRARARKSSWPQICTDLTAIDSAPIRALQVIRRQLRARCYEFSAKQGYTKRKSGGSRRGITVQSVSDRIVQRSILSVIYTQDRDLQKLLGEIPATLDTPTSFAGAPGRGVPEAIASIMQAIARGASAFTLSDMKDFFPCVPRSEVVEFLKANVHDVEFLELFARALETELANGDELEQWLDLFPLSEVGVAQGSLLSVLVGNLALRDFDRCLNGGELTTVRYLDDFIILGKSAEVVSAGFQTAQEELAKLGMTCYEPGDGSQKAFLGSVANGFDFLGCRIHPDGVSPARRARRKLLGEIVREIAEAKSRIRELSQPAARRRAERAYAQTLATIDNKIRGWGDAYRFVSNRVAFAQIDEQIDGLVDGFQRWFVRRCFGADPRTKRRITGVALLGDTPPRPLVLPCLPGPKPGIARSRRPTSR